MSEIRQRKPVYQKYYTAEDYEEVLEKLPDIIEDAERKAAELLEPTIFEKREIIELVKQFIKKKNRKIYGGTALNEALKIINPKDAIYDDFNFSDIEFYSMTPLPDLLDLCDLIHSKGYKYVVGQQARHDETFTIFVNFQVYCDITYVPSRVYNGIKTLIIDGINYVDPHFMLIDQLRMINQPLTAAAQRWEKAFKRTYLLLKDYPFEYFDKNLSIPKLSSENQSYITKIKNEFMVDPEIQKSCLITGFEAYNFYINHAMGNKNSEQMARTKTSDTNKTKSNKPNNYSNGTNKNLTTNIPYFELISVSYRDTVEKIYIFLKKIVVDPKQLSLEEYFPLFQFTNYSVIINYQGNPIVRIFEGDGFCIPSVKTKKGYMYVSYQYLLMSLLISKFNSHLDKNREMYFNYGISISNLVFARNEFLKKNNYGVINNTVFGEFRINCIGSTVSYARESRLRGIKQQKEGKKYITYKPDDFFKTGQESQIKFRNFINEYNQFRNTSGNKIIKPKNLLFRIDDEGNIAKDLDDSDLSETNPADEKSDNYKNERTSDTKMNDNKSPASSDILYDTNINYAPDFDPYVNDTETNNIR